MNEVDILFVSRGRGRGHATRDLAISGELRRLRPGVRISFCSYSIGATVFAAAGEEVYDLHLPEKNLFTETIIRSAEVIAAVRPRLVVAQEEPAALVASSVHGRSAAFTTHWFPLRKHVTTEPLQLAKQILFMEDEGIFIEPPEVQGRTTYCGPVLRRFAPSLRLANEYKESLGMRDDCLFVLVLPGSPPEHREPIFDLVVQAFSRLSAPHRRLLWVAGYDFQKIAARAATIPHVMVIESSHQIDALMLASDVVLSKGTYNISRETMAHGRPCIALSHGYNWVDDLFAQRWPHIDFRKVSETSASLLTERIQIAASGRDRYGPQPALLQSNGAAIIAFHLADLLKQC
jgi:hypothetical protein